MTQVMDVIVIGCGASGIAALRRLHDAGLKAIGIEAADRIGGRIYTTDGFGKGAIDLGAAWCHGEKDNIVFELANPHGLLGRPEVDTKWFITSSGDVLPVKDGEKVVGEFDEALAKAEKNNDRSISDVVRETAKSESTLKENPLTPSFVEWYERNNHLGGQNYPKEGKSLRGLVEGWPCEGEFMLNWKGKGYKSILDILLNRYPDPSKELPISIHKNKEVETIKWKGNRQSGNPDNSLVQIKFKDGSLYAAKSVIVTVSIGVLKERHRQLFDPPLPQQKIDVINSMQMCVLDKIYIEFTEPWWPNTPASFTVLWKPEDKKKFNQNDQWITEIYGLMTVNEPNVLLAWIYGEGAKEMELKSEGEVREGVNKLLDMVFKKQFDVTPIKKIIRSQWASNALARGAYAYRSVATEQNGGHGASVLSEPLENAGDPVVCFAGEATSLHRHTAVHGAVEAGFREADRLIQAFKNKTQ